MNLLFRKMTATVIFVVLAGCGSTVDGGADAGQQPTDSVEPQIDTGTPPADPGAMPDTGPPATPWVGGPDDWVTDESLRPHSLHVTWVGDTGTAATVQWQTTLTAPGGYDPMVWFASEDEVHIDGDLIEMPFDDSHTAQGAGFNYLTFTDEESNVEVVQWAVDLSGLVPDTVYYYRAGTWDGFDVTAAAFDNPDFTPVYSFRTGQTKGIRTPFNFVAAGDSRTDGGKLAANSPRLAEIDANFWLFTGDMTEVGTQQSWWYWFESMKPVLSRKVLMPVQGNHEFLADMYYNQWSLPGEAGLPQEYKEHGWSFDYGNLHVVGLDSNYSDTVEGQKAWLDDDLGEARSDPDIDWILVIFHQAAYSASNHGSTKYVQEHWVPLFDKHDVDLVINGHDHNYERTHPLRGDKIAEDGNGTVYVVAGGFYAPGYGNGNEWWTATSTHGDKGNYTLIHVDGTSLTLTAYSGDGTEVLDEFNLTR